MPPKNKPRTSNQRKRKSTRSPIKTTPKVARVPSRVPQVWPKANTNMNLTELQYMAGSLGLAFGGLDKSRLIREINLLRQKNSVQLNRNHRT